MINSKEFKETGYKFIDWIADYFDNIEKYPVKANTKPKEIFNKIDNEPPAESQSIEDIFEDFKNIILPGISHWQSPNFFAYFPANTSYPSILAELLTSALGTLAMKWETSPAATELEDKVMLWLRKLIGLPDTFTGVIQDTASTSTLTAILTAREKYSNYSVNNKGFTNEKFRVYCSTETHSSIEKGTKIAGIGRENLIKIETDEKFALKPELLEEAIKNDINNGNKPICVVAAIGTTGSTAVDSIDEIGKICKKYDIWLHVDAAYLGSALILPEYQWMIKGIENANSFVFNAHKWLFTNFDCSLFFIKDEETLIKTFQILPEYLKMKHQGEVHDFSDWGIQLGRKFRALKLWFVIRNFGVKGLQENLREHINLGEKFENFINTNSDFELLAPRSANLICFRYNPANKNLSEELLNEINAKLMKAINESGKIYLSHTKLKGKYAIRFVCAQTNVKEENIDKAWNTVKEFVLKEVWKNQK